jgi:hypothetical protein
MYEECLQVQYLPFKTEILKMEEREKINFQFDHTKYIVFCSYKQLWQALKTRISNAETYLKIFQIDRSESV